MPVIRIDDDVMNELKKRAVELGLVFEPPNSTMRKILNLDEKNRPNSPVGALSEVTSPEVASPEVASPEEPIQNDVPIDQEDRRIYQGSALPMRNAPNKKSWMKRISLVK